MDGVGTFRWHQVTFFLRFVTPARRFVLRADLLLTARGTTNPKEKVTRPKDIHHL